MSLTKQDICDVLVKKIGFTKTEALTLVNDFFHSIKEELIKGEDVKLSGFGNFTLNNKKLRIGRNPKTKKEAVISARRVVTFKAGPKFKKIVQQKGELEG